MFPQSPGPRWFARLLVLVVSLVHFGNAGIAVAEPRPPQYVVFAFDGSLMLGRWKDTLDYVQSLRKSLASPFSFTYFISGVYFLSPQTKTIYQGPHHSAGQSDIGFSDSKADILPRIDFVNRAYSEGNEIGSHANGHFHADEQSWTQSDWEAELSFFPSLIFQYVFTNNGFSSAEAKAHAWDNRIEPGVIGFRAPYLEMGKGLYPALLKNGFRYDTSQTAPMAYLPKKIGGIWNFPLAEIKIAGTGKKTLSMDYNFYYAQSGASPESDSAKCKEYEDQMYSSYINYFTSNYNGNRAPVHIGHHFSLWNKGAYWNAEKRFAEAVCGMPEVRCVTYRELADALEGTRGESLLAWETGQFEPGAAMRIETPSGRALDLGLEFSRPSVDVLQAVVTGADAGPKVQIHWEADRARVSETFRVELGRLASLQLGGAARLSAVATIDGREVYRSTHLVSGGPDYVMASEDLEDLAMKGDLPGAHEEHAIE